MDTEKRKALETKLDLNTALADQMRDVLILRFSILARQMPIAELHAFVQMLEAMHEEDK